MPRSLILAVVFASSACAAIWPEKLGQYQRQATSSVSPPQNPEYGSEVAERADYGPFQVTAARFKDPTGAYAASLESPVGFRVGN
jgi:hypothetical protein